MALRSSTGSATMSARCRTIRKRPASTSASTAGAWTQVADVGALDELAAMCAAMIEDEPDPRQFTKDIIAETVTLHQHLGERGPAIIGAALCLTAESETAMAALKEGGTALLCEITYDDDARTRRMQLKVLDKPPG